MHSFIRRAASRVTSRSIATHTKLTPFVTRLDEQNRTKFNGPLKAIILDWSGTTADAHVLAPAVVFVDVFEKHGVPISMAEAREPMGLRKDLHIGKILEMPAVRERWTIVKGSAPTSSTVDELFADFVPMQLACLEKYTTLLPGAADTVKTLQNDYKMLVGSTTGFVESMVDILLADAKKQGYVPDYSVAGDQVENNMGFRPAPFMVYKNMVNLGVFPIESVLKVDDTVSGVGEGVNAGCWAVGVAGLSNYTNVDSLEQWDAMSAAEKEERVTVSREKLYGSGAHYVIDKISDIIDVVNDVNKRLAFGEKPQDSHKSQISNREC